MATWARIAQSVQGLATGWTTRGSNPDGAEIFRTRLDQSCGRLAYCTMGTGSFPALERPGRGFDHPPPWGGAQVKKKKSSDIPLLPFWAFMACSGVNFTFIIETQAKLY